VRRFAQAKDLRCRAIYRPAFQPMERRQLVWVLEGTLTFIEGDMAHTLAACDCLELGPPSDFTFRNDKRRPCRYAVVILRQAQ
jgi:uncharacterized cupin superfamily protein